MLLWTLLKVEATKFTEVGYHGRDVDQILRDLVEAGMKLQREKLEKRHKPAAMASINESHSDCYVDLAGCLPFPWEFCFMMP